jgi:hypothetical protein
MKMATTIVPITTRKNDGSTIINCGFRASKNGMRTPNVYRLNPDGSLDRSTPNGYQPCNGCTLPSAVLAALTRAMRRRHADVLKSLSR